MATYNETIEIVQNLEKEIKKLKDGIQEILDRFIQFTNYTKEDYESAMSDLAELLEG